MRKRLYCLFGSVAAVAATAVSTSTTLAQTPGSSPMAYYIAEFEPTTPGAIQPYSAQVEATFRPFGGRFIVRGGDVDALEGNTPKGRLIIIAFDSIDQARAWYRSPAYEKIKPIRFAAGNSNVYIVQGTPPLVRPSDGGVSR